jgi:3-dehydroquinate dehydratase/shikimate dehydrogenase
MATATDRQTRTDAARLCATVTGTTVDELRRARDDAAASADLVELRIDGVRSPDLPCLVDGRTRPVIVTCRAAWEGGRFEGREDERHRLLQAALDAGAEFVDVEWRADFRDRLLAHDSSRVVVSLHDFAGVPADLEDQWAAMSRTAAAVVKLAVMPHRLRDLLGLFALSEVGRRPKILIGMGAMGAVSRVLAARFGSCWTYAGDGIGPGQISLARMRDEFRVNRITDATEIYAVVGRPVAHSISPAMHNAALAAMGRDAVYVPLEAVDFAEAMEFADRLGVAGMSVTSPFKHEALASADSADPLATRVGAANTLTRSRDGRWMATNTDVEGFLRPLAGNAGIASWRVAVVGAGGAARAVTAALRGQGAHVTVCARRPEAAQVVAGAFDAESGAWPPAEGPWDLVVNTTPVGTWPDVSASPLEGVTFRARLVYDLVYNPEETALLRHARAAGAHTLSGLDMLVWQAALQLQTWIGKDPPIEVMRRAARARLAEMSGS